MDDEKEINIILYGTSGVGCSELSEVAIGQKFEINLENSTAWSHREKKFIINEKKYVVNLWNGPGQEINRSIFKIILKTANIINLVYDINKRETFYSLKEYICIVREILGDNIIGAIVGNKIDLQLPLSENIFKENDIEREARKIAKGIGFKFTLVSAKNDINPFIKLLEELVKDFIERDKENNILNNKILKKNYEKKDEKKKIEEDIKGMDYEKKASLNKNYKLILLKYFSK